MAEVYNYLHIACKDEPASCGRMGEPAVGTDVIVHMPIGVVGATRVV